MFVENSGRRIAYNLRLLALLIIFASHRPSFCFQPFDDSTLFKIDWPGRSTSFNAEETFEKYTKDFSPKDDQTILVSSSENEKYICKLPEIPEKDRSNLVEYFGPTPKQLIKTLYDQRICNYRIDLYWTYEFCHGQYLLQYHEEKDVRRTSRQEYYLGQYIAEIDKDDRDAAIDYVSKPPRRKIEDQMLPYYAVDYHQGTACDITGRPRRTTVYYVCDNDQQNDKGQIRSFDEVTSCEYELVVATSRLCAHPGFRQEKSKEHKIECFPADKGSPPTPDSLTIWQKESKWRLLYGGQGENEKAGEKSRIIIPFLPKNIDLESILEELKSEAEEDEEETTASEEQETPQTSPRPSSVTPVDQTVTKPPADQSLAKAFLSGEQCLYGGSGWWRFEYCHMKHVLQYHVDEQDGSTTAKVLLGVWDLDLHSLWLSGRPHKRPFRAKDSSSVLQVSHFYGGGDRCEETGEKRSVEVRLKCLTSKGVSLNAVSLTLLEPRTCEYVLRVESPMICAAIQTANERGILN